MTEQGRRIVDAISVNRESLFRDVADPYEVAGKVLTLVDPNFPEQQGDTNRRNGERHAFIRPSPDGSGRIRVVSYPVVATSIPVFDVFTEGETRDGIREPQPGSGDFRLVLARLMTGRGNVYDLYGGFQEDGLPREAHITAVFNSGEPPRVSFGIAASPSHGVEHSSSTPHRMRPERARQIAQAFGVSKNQIR